MLRTFYFVLFILFSCSTAVAQDKTPTYLNRWQFRNINETDWYKASVPGNIYDDLYKNNLIDYPLFGTNYEATEWIENEIWEYSTYFDTKKTSSIIGKKTEFELVFKGINTFAEVILNGQVILLCDNFSRIYRIDISKIALEKNNYLIVRFFNEKNYEKLLQDLKLTKPTSQHAGITTMPSYFEQSDFARPFSGFGFWKEVLLVEKGAEIYQQAEPLSKFNVEYFCLENDVDDINTKSAVWLPMNIFTGANSKQDYEQMLTLVKQANINCLRVWGGAYYENEIFYDLCSKYEIAVIQDIVINKHIMSYSAKDIQTWKKDIIDNVKQLSQYKCIVAWAGNIENEFYINEDLLNKGYYKSFVEDSLGSLIQVYDKRPFFVWNYQHNDKFPSYAQYNAWWDNSNAKVNSKLSHNSFQALPDIHSIKKISKNIRGDSYQLYEHQKTKFGFERINLELEKYPPAKDSIAYIYFTQLIQRDALSGAINKQRALFPYKKGSSIWHFNDVWPGVTCSIVDYFKKPKAAYYKLKELYNDNYIAIGNAVVDENGKNYLDTNQYTKAFILNNPELDPGSTKGNLYVLNFYGDTVFKSLNFSWKNAGRNQLYYPDLFVKSNQSFFNWNTQYIKIDLNDATDHVVYSQRMFLGAARDYKFEKTHIFYNWLNNQTLELEAANFSKDVYIYCNSSKVNFSENYFDMEKGEKKIIRVDHFNPKKDKLEIFTFYDMCVD